MDVFIIDKELRTNKKYQVMTRRGNCFFHVFPGQLFTLEEAKNICDKNGFNVVKIGDIWQCA